MAIAAAATVVAVAVAFFKTLIAPVAIALLLAVLLFPLVQFFERRLKLKRTLAAGLALLTLVVVVVALIALAGRQIAKGMPDLLAQARAGLDQLVTWLAQGPLHIDANQVNDWIDTATQALKDNLKASSPVP